MIKNKVICDTSKNKKERLNVIYLMTKKQGP